MHINSSTNLNYTLIVTLFATFGAKIMAVQFRHKTTSMLQLEGFSSERNIINK